MAATATYLEFSEGSSHKFYEVAVEGCELRVRFGRVGEAGQGQTKTFPTPERARAEADKKLREKRRKGYVDVVREAPSSASPPESSPAIPSAAFSAMRSPVLWRFDTGNAAFGIAITPYACWVGNQQGRIFKLDPQGHVVNQYHNTNSQRV